MLACDGRITDEQKAFLEGRLERVIESTARAEIVPSVPARLWQCGDRPPRRPERDVRELLSSGRLILGRLRQRH